MYSLPLPAKFLPCLAATLFIVLPGNPCRAATPAAAASDDDWTLISKSDDVSIYSRTRSGATIKEFKAVGNIKAPPRALLAVLDDIDAYTRFMPYITECRVIKREPDSIISYQRVSPPFCTDRDYSIRVRHNTRSTPAGSVYMCRWDLANDLGPSEKNDVLRVKINEGSWLIEPAAGNTARATYRIYTDSGGALPGWLANKANQIGIGKLFEAIRKQVKDPKYSSFH